MKKKESGQIEKELRCKLKQERNGLVGKELRSKLNRESDQIGKELRSALKELWPNYKGMKR